jgi:hypothetical protein
MSIGIAVLLGIGMVLVVEGLVFALLPGRLEDILRMMAEMPLETRRIVGLSAVTLGVVVVYFALALGA